MTVLVLEDPELIKRAARAVPPVVAPGLDEVATDKPRRPEKVRFQFAFDSHQLDPQAESVLRDHGRYLKAHPDQRLVLTGHTDRHGAEAYNRSLSRLRAAAAARILREAGARDKQIEVIGIGSDQPLEPDNDLANRRLELSYQEPHLALTH